MRCLIWLAIMGTLIWLLGLYIIWLCVVKD